jgi:pimeloyl-ACP methyl ester carboxylesterase
MKEYYFERRGICYRTNEFQAGRPTLVWIHGLSGSASAWFPYERIFGNYNLLTFDLRGHGLSARPRHYEEYDLRLCADDVYELLEHVGVETCVLVSHSFGTLVALELVRAHQEKASSLILLSPTAFLGQTRWFPLVRTVSGALITLCRVLPFRTTKRGRIDYTIFTYTGDWDLRRIVRDIRNTTIHAYLYCLLQAYAKNYDKMWEGISVPTLILHGADDHIIPVSHAVQLSMKIPGAALVQLDKANHIVVLNNIQEVSGHIKHFLGAQ